MSDPKFDPEEETKPNRLCPDCMGEGERMVRLDTGTRVLRTCPTCTGRKRVNAEEMRRYLASPRRED